MSTYPAILQRAREIRKIASEGKVTVQDLSVMYGLSPITIRAILLCHRSATEEDNKVYIHKVRRNERAKVARLLRMLGFTYKAIARHSKCCHSGAYRLAHLTCGGHTELAVTLLESVRNVHNENVPKGEYTLSHDCDSLPDEIHLHNQRTSHFVRVETLIGKITL